ncbi:MAG: carboxylating nicotinate-nucleotide diphosphorylase [Deltaproteobacteria bacterium]|nr:carboxylating nicotinate-nucleotide diphosphorylase [Deltaproteobacteria bacterium]MBN2686890.1 carboxylating nicotinate-nucleotide diphosphorylase [Deltaproteobacteria bacterium]
MDALDEDIGSGDLTTSALLTGGESGTGRTVAKSEVVIAGIDVFREVFHAFDNELDFMAYLRDGEVASPGNVIAEVSGRLQSILTSERVALNFFQRMCGIATLTRKFVDMITGTKAKILDTRKTVAGHRDLDKYAVTVGGGQNHRLGLDGGVMIKDNHIIAAGNITKAVQLAATAIPPTIKIEVEVKNQEEAVEALAAGADIIMLDNMSISEMKKAVSLIDGRALIEASGNVTLSNVREIAQTGVDFISVGALTHSVAAADLSLTIVAE